MSNRSEAARKANQTRRNRREFEDTYTPETYDVVQVLTEPGMTTQQAAEITGLPRTVVAAYKANLTRGAYYPYVYVENNSVLGICRF